MIWCVGHITFTSHLNLALHPHNVCNWAQTYVLSASLQHRVARNNCMNVDYQRWLMPSRSDIMDILLFSQNNSSQSQWDRCRSQLSDVSTPITLTLTSVPLGSASCLERIVRYATYNHTEIFNLIIWTLVYITESQHTVHSYLHSPYTYIVCGLLFNLARCMYWC